MKTRSVKNKTINTAAKGKQSNRPLDRIKRVLKVLGPGFVTGAADDDPTAIAAYTQSGAHFGYRLLWTALFTIPFMTVVQEMCGTIGAVTGKGLAHVIKEHYSKKILYGSVMCLLIANVINIGADLGAMAATVQLLVRVPFILLLVTITLVTVAIEVFVPYNSYVKYLQYLTLTLLAYVVVAFMVRQNWSEIAVSTFIPHISFTKDYLLSVLAILGTNISPYLFFWQASQEVEEEVKHNKLQSMEEETPRVTARYISRVKLDTMVGMSFSNVIVFFICITAASTLGAHGITDIQTPSQAAEALRPLAGNLTFVLFTIGIIGSGLLAVPVLAGSTSYAIAESFGWKEGLYRKPKSAYGFYGAIAVATVVGLFVNVLGIKPFQMLVYSAALNAIVAPPLLVLIMLISNNKKIIGEHRNSWIANALGILITVLMFMASVGFFISLRE
jgi:NRAMP (natural resistance-associated macrophage protein)-like metal ion transporter